MLRVPAAVGLLAMTVGLNGAASDFARAETAAVVPALERRDGLFDGDPAEAGRLLLVELNCLACHAGNPAAMEGFSKRREGPDLSDVAGRVRLDYLRAMIADPGHAKPGTPMPRVALGTDDQRQRQVEAIVHFLAVGGPGSPVDQMPDRQAAERGRRLFTEVGCAACHDRPGSVGPALPSSFPLGNLGAKYSIPTLARFLHDPLAVRHSGRMPSLKLSDQQSRDLANALVDGLALPPNLHYRAFEGQWDRLPDFRQLKPYDQGQVAGFDLAVAKRRDHFALEFEGYLQIETPGSYIFFLTSDDGARLVVDGETMVEHDGIHPEGEEESDKHQFSAGPHHVLVQYFDGGGETALAVEFESNKAVPRQGLAAAMTLTRDPPKKPNKGFRVDPQMAAEGRRLFASAGCAACHELKREGQKFANQLAAPHFDRLRPERGCLASEPPAGAPRFALSARQRTALAAALSAGSNTPVSPETAIARTMATFNCYACHVRSKRGGVEAARNDFFITAAREMGDEGRIPPSLDGVGAKLTETYFKRIMEQGAKDRPYMLARMPRFGLGNVGHLPALFVTVDAQKWPPLPQLDLPEYRIKSDGRFLVGGRAFSCVKCHNFGKYEGEGIQAIDMTTMTQRLRPEWFRRYLHDPAAMRPGTRMPAAWPKTGRSMLRDVLGGDSDRQIAAVWIYLRDGADAAPPFGVAGQAIELVPDTEPIVYRNFIAGAGPRGIAVGYPEKVNLAIDGNQMQLVLVWRGPFIDASRHWSQRSAGFQGPLGDQVLPLVGGVPLAELEDLERPWPSDPAKTLGYQFRGYELDAQRRPKFHYQWHDLKIDDFYLPTTDATTVPAQTRLERTLSVTGRHAGESLYFRAARAKQIEPLDDGWFRIDKNWKMRLSANGGRQPVIRHSAGELELLVPLELSTGRETIRQTISW